MSNQFLKSAIRGVQGLTPYLPGKPVEELERELGISESIKLASNENPLGASKKAIQAATRILHDMHLYPDGSGYRLKAKLSQVHAVNENTITLGNGSNDILELIARAFMTENDAAVFSEYAFAVYPIVTQAIGAESRIARAFPADHASMPYGHDLDAMLEKVNEKTKVIFLANPNNPTGTWLEPESIKAFLNKVPANIIVVLDEAYYEYMPDELKPDSISWLSEFPNLVITRTFSKIYALAGLRIGYSISHPDIADLLNRVRQPFNVNLVAQQAALAALDDEEHIQQSVRCNNDGLLQLKTGFEELGLTSIPSIGNFITVNINQNSAPVYDALLREGVIVRPLANYGLPQHLRVTVGTADQNLRVLNSMKKVLS